MNRSVQYFSGSRLHLFMASPVVSLTCTFRSLFIKGTLLCLGVFITVVSSATVYTVSDKTTLQSKMNAAVPGDTVIVLNGSYNWGQISFTNNNSNSNSGWIVLRAQSVGGVIFTGATYLHFKGTKVEVNGFKFINGNAGSNAVVSFRSSSSNLSSYCRITNITIDNYNSDTETDNEWVALYGTNNRVDHCTFINKSNVRATIVVWYSSTTYPNPATSTFHRIDSNYFKGRSYMGSNGGETIRVGDSNSSRTNGYNTIEFNLFEDCIQTEPEIISNKSDFNVYRYNTFKNSKGGLTLRHGRYCSVYGNFFIVDDPNVTHAYGIRVIDKGHKIFNNYFEAVNGNSGSLTSARAPICLYNGLSSTLDTNDAAKASGYFPADSTIVAFNTIVNAKGGAGIVLGYTDGGANTFQPLGIKVSNNVIKMSQGQAMLLSSSNTSLTYLAEGNMYQAPSGLGLSSSVSFSSTTLSFNNRINGVLQPPSVVQDAAINSSEYSSLISVLDVHGKTRSVIYDVGSLELDGSGDVLYQPLTSSMVGAGSSLIVLPLKLLSFDAVGKAEIVQLSWKVADIKPSIRFSIEWSTAGRPFVQIGLMQASYAMNYRFEHATPFSGNNFYRLKIVDVDGSVMYSSIQQVNFTQTATVKVYPNPASDKFYISLKEGSYNAKIFLVNAFGKVVKHLIRKSAEVDVRSLPPGVYSLQIVVNNNIVAHPLIIAR